jgi:hypothetical protein
MTLRTTLLAGLLLASSVKAQDAGPNLLLANKFGELCTMCVGTLSCSAGDSGARTTYAFQKKTFLGQMMTVLDFVPGRGKRPWETRPVVITATKSDGTTTTRTENGRLSVKEARIEAGGTIIDRTNGAWTTNTGAPLGTCQWTDPTPTTKAGASP